MGQLKRLVDLSGRIFGKITVVSRAPDGKHRVRRWHCLCLCGAEKIIHGEALLRGRTKSCGCIRKEDASTRFATHRKSKSRTYSIWFQMKKRCINQDSPAYPDYGGRGIFFCEEWAKFENFLADMGEAPDGLTLERKNNDGGYEPNNCRWATRADQARNRRSSVFLTINGKTQTLSEWAIEADLDASLIHYRIKKGWPDELLLRRPVKLGKNRLVLAR